MTTLPLALNPTRAPILWLLGTALGWSLVPLVLQGQNMRTYLEVAQALPIFLLLGLAVGALTGLGQMQAWQGAAARRWLWTTVLAYGLALPAGLLIGIAIPTFTSSLSWGLRTGNFGLTPWAPPGAAPYAAFPFSVIYIGPVVGLCQWSALKLWLAPARPAMAWLWVAGVWAGVGLGLFAGGWLITPLLGSGGHTGLTLALWGALWGAVAGLVSVGVLWVLQRESRRLTQ